MDDATEAWIAQTDRSARTVWQAGAVGADQSTTTLRFTRDGVVRAVLRLGPTGMRLTRGGKTESAELSRGQAAALLSSLDALGHPGARRAHAQPEEHRPRHPQAPLVVITGLSGSGKSSLAFDTLYAEGQRRYVESLSAYARQFLQLMDKPDVDVIEGLSPAISIEQKATSHNPRSTVGTVTEIHDYLRLLYARAGTPFCPDHACRCRRRASARWSTPCWRCPRARG
jgi:hypothetical protein